MAAEGVVFVGSRESFSIASRGVGNALEARSCGTGGAPQADFFGAAVAFPVEPFGTDSGVGVGVDPVPF